MSKVQRKWWFALPVATLTAGCTIWLCWALGFADPISPFSLPHLFVFVISVEFFRRLFSWLLWWALVWFAPTWVGEKRLNS